MSVNYIPQVSNDTGNNYPVQGMIMPQSIQYDRQPSLSSDEFLMIKDKIEEMQTQRKIAKYCSVGGIIAGIATGLAGLKTHKGSWIEKGLTALFMPISGILAGDFISATINMDTDKITGKGISKAICSGLALVLSSANCFNRFKSQYGSASKFGKALLVSESLISILSWGSIGNWLGSFVGKLFDNK